MLAFLFLLPLVCWASTPTYCLCSQEFVYDPNGDCTKSALYGVENACYRCPVVNASGTFNYCGSMGYLGYGACNTMGAVAARAAACTSIGGDTSLTSYVCTTSLGPNTSQLSGCTGASPTATAQPTTATTAQPTSGMDALHVPLFFWLSAIMGALLV